MRSSLSATLTWRILNFVQALFTALWTAFWVSAALVVLAVTWNHEYPLIMARRIWSAGLLWGARARIEVKGLENVDFTRPHIFVCNHESAIDIPVVFRALPTNLHFMLKQELKWVPFVGWFAIATGMIFIDRKNRLNALSSLRRAAALIRAGRSVIAFPEGTRSRGNDLLPFKKGAFVAATEARVPIVPVAIEGARRVLPCEGWFRVRPGTIRVRVGKPISTENLSLSDNLHLPEIARQAVLKLRVTPHR